MASKAVTPPSSAFSELLRRSRFASYDPAIAQTYTSPQAHARRGNYGLKRPIPMPYKDSYITVNQFEHHAQFTEWNNAEPMVKFVQRIEELNITPRSAPNGEWDKTLGMAKTHWLLDSEFAESEYGAEKKPYEPIDGLGRQGAGAYGANRPPPQQASEQLSNSAQLNIAALPPRQFKRHLEKLRKLSPEFRAYLIEHHKARHLKRQAELDSEAASEYSTAAIPTEEFKEEDLMLYIAGQANYHRLHRRFLATHRPSSPPTGIGKVTTPALPSPSKIDRQPHRTGALTYTHYSPLETVLTTPPQPGLVLQNTPDPSAYFLQRSKSGKEQRGYIALFAGMTSTISRVHAGTSIPFYDPDAGDEMAVGHGPGESKSDSDSTPPSTTAESSSSFSSTSTPTFSQILSSPPPDPSDPLRIKPSQATLRLLSLALRNPPTTITGYSAHLSKPKDHLDSTQIFAESSTDLPHLKRTIGGNPYRIGSMEYCGHGEMTPRDRYSGGVGVGGVSGYGGVGDAFYGGRFSGVAAQGEGEGRAIAGVLGKGAKYRLRKQIAQMAGLLDSRSSKFAPAAGAAATPFTPAVPFTPAEPETLFTPAKSEAPTTSFTPAEPATPAEPTSAHRMNKSTSSMMDAASDLAAFGFDVNEGEAKKKGENGDEEK